MPGRSQKETEEEIQRFLDANKGDTVRLEDVAVWLGRTKQRASQLKATIQRLAPDRTILSKGESKKKGNEDKVATFKERDDLSIKEIAEQTGVGEGTVGNTLRRLGVDRHGQTSGSLASRRRAYQRKGTKPGARGFTIPRSTVDERTAKAMQTKRDHPERRGGRGHKAPKPPN